jgi:hypothetical protein
MANDYEDDKLDYDIFWTAFEDSDSLNEKVANLVTRERERWIAATYSTQAYKLRSEAIWKECEQAGLSVLELTDHIDLNPDNLRRKLQKGGATEPELFLAVSMAGLNASELLSPPTARQRFVAKSRTVGRFKQHSDTVYLPGIERDRVPLEETLEPHDTALLSALFSDWGRIAKWLYLTIPIASNLALIAKYPILTEFVESIYTSARMIDCLESPEIEFLVSWSPRRAGPEKSLQHLARLWNRYQMHWFVTSEVIGVI